MIVSNKNTVFKVSSKKRIFINLLTFKQAEFQWNILKVMASREHWTKSKVD